MKTTFGKIIAPLLTLFIVAALGVMTGWRLHQPLEVFAAEAPEVAVNPAPITRQGKLDSFAPVVERVAPSVVYVYSTRTVRRPSMSELFGDSVLRRFFGDQFDEDSTPRSYKQHGLGSGVIVSKDGYILTNNHVVEGADEVRVALVEGKKEFTTKVIGHDAKTDLAVLKIEGSDYSFATLADSDKLKVGDVVLAVGNPFGVGQAVTMGIVSATRRGGMGIEQYEDFIQTDAAINPGNSGGALVDAEGRLVGINTAILSRSGGFQGVGFAVPINLAKTVLEQLIKTGHVVRGYLGVSIQNLTPELGKEFNVPGGNGALVGGVVENGAAASAGLMSGDVIVEFNGKPIEDSRQLMLQVGNLAPGAKANVKVMRAGKEKTFTVTLQQMPEEPSSVATNAQPEPGDVLAGVTVADPDSATRQQLDLPSNVKGALVTRIDPRSPAFEAGLRAGDLIQQIDRQDVKNAEEAMALSQKVKDKQVLLRVWTQGSSRFLVVNERTEK